MNILAVGDIVGNCGINKLKGELQDIKNKYSMIKEEYVEQMCKDEYEINVHEDI